MRKSSTFMALGIAIGLFVGAAGVSVASDIAKTFYVYSSGAANSNGQAICGVNYLISADPVAVEEYMRADVARSFPADQGWTQQHYRAIPVPRRFLEEALGS